MADERFKLVFTVPHTHLELVKAAMFAAGVGTSPTSKYSHACSQSPVTGQFRPVAALGAKPFLGEPDKLVHVEEMRVEVLCVSRETTRKAVEALKE